ncbi:putative signal peptide protein [Puccinia sorghi]|uniref:Putative signal peptide protein n=1 Tax=Puccinia sorghi TaxID=27349 RepID=A0A0L6UKA2_9BASI|nr:putative signal peptide protein [Puccinia sorghi]
MIVFLMMWGWRVMIFDEKDGLKGYESRFFNQKLNSGPLGGCIKTQKDCVGYMEKIAWLGKATIEVVVLSFNQCPYDGMMIHKWQARGPPYIFKIYDRFHKIVCHRLRDYCKPKRRLGGFSSLNKLNKMDGRLYAIPIWKLRSMVKGFKMFWKPLPEGGTQLELFSSHQIRLKLHLLIVHILKLYFLFSSFIPFCLLHHTSIGSLLGHYVALVFLRSALSTHCLFHLFFSFALFLPLSLYVFGVSQVISHPLLLTLFPLMISLRTLRIDHSSNENIFTIIRRIIKNSKKTIFIVVSSQALKMNIFLYSNMHHQKFQKCFFFFYISSDQMLVFIGNKD